MLDIPIIKPRTESASKVTDGRITLDHTKHLTDAQINRVIDNMRLDFQHEFSCVGLVPQLVGLQMVRSSFVSVYAAIDGQPEFILGAVPQIQGVFGIWGFGTNKTKRAVPALTRYVNDCLIPGAFGSGIATRLEIRVPAQSQWSIDWLCGACGFVPEAMLPGYSDVPHVQLRFSNSEYIDRYVHVPTASDAADGGTGTGTH